MPGQYPPSAVLIALFITSSRYILVIPSAIMGYDGILLYNDTRKLEILSMISQGPRFLKGLEIGGKVVGAVPKIARMG